MRKISSWASRHVWPSRLLIIFCAVFLHFLSMSLGDLFHGMGYAVPFSFFYLPAATALLAFIFYPFAEERSRYRNFYAVRKTFDSVLLVSTFWMLFIGANNQQYAIFNPPAAAHTSVTASVMVEKPGKEKKKRFSVQQMRKKTIENIQILRKLYREATPGEKIGLIILASFLLAALLSLVMALSCNLSCAGSGTAAAIVGVGGTALLIFLFVRVIRGLNRKYRAKEKEIKN